MFKLWKISDSNIQNLWMESDYRSFIFEEAKKSSKEYPNNRFFIENILGDIIWDSETNSQED